MPFLKKIMDDLSATSAVERVVFMKGTQIGGPLALDTPVATLTGWTTMGQIAVGDHVFDEAGKPTRVSYVSPIFIDRPCWTMRFSDGAEIVCDGEHRWTVESDVKGAAHRKVKTLTTDQIRATLKKGNRNRYAIPLTKSLSLPDAALPIAPYSLGVWLGDGSGSSNQITIHKDDAAEVAGYIRADGYRAEPRRPDWCKGNVANIIVDPRLDRDGICARGHILSETGVYKRVKRGKPVEVCAECGRQAAVASKYGRARKDAATAAPSFLSLLAREGLLNNKHIPQAYLRASADQRRALLQGLMDTDGHVAPGGQCELIFAHKVLVDGATELIRSLGMKPRVTTRKGLSGYAKNCADPVDHYRIAFKAYPGDAPARMVRKAQRVTLRGTGRASEARRRRIVAIEPHASVPVRCIAVEAESHLFLAGREMVATHNTEVGLNWLGYIIENTPGMALLVMDTMPTIKKNTRTRIDPMIAATPVLRQRISKTRANEPGNTHSSKTFPGGELIMTGANADGPLRSTPVRFVMLDEVDAYPLDVDKAGDPVDLAIERTATFEGMRKIFMVSSPRLESTSRIAKAFKEGNQQFFWVPCPMCGEFQTITWAKIKWPEGEPRKAYMACEHCGGVVEEHQKPAMLAAGEWRAEAAGDGVTASYHLSSLYSPQRPWGRIAADFLAAKNDPPRLKTWVNTRLGETWRDEGDIVIEAEVLMARTEEFDEDELAPEVLCLTAGVDVQDNRLECEIVAWGPGEESWSLDYAIFHGDPSKVEVWADLDRLLLRKWAHPTRDEIGLSSVCVDSGGHFTAQVLNFCALRERRRVWAIKGASGQGKPPFPRVASQSKKHGRQPVHIIGVDGLKESFYRRLAIMAPGPGYSHFPADRDLAWFQQLTAERLLVKYSKGRRVQEWTVKQGTRNEALDCRIYAMAALEGLKMRGVWRALKADQFERKRRLDDPATTVARETQGSAAVASPVATPPPPVRPSPNRPSFLNHGRPVGRPSFFR